MKTTNELFSSAGRAGAALVLASLCLASPSFAKKGGGGKPEDPPPPEPEPAPINYAVSWLTPADSPDESRLWDIDSNGVAVGQIRPNGSAEDRFGIVSFPGRAPINLETLVQSGTHQGDQLPTGWKLNAVVTISDNLLVGGDLIPAEGSGYTYGAFAAQLSDDGTDVSVDWFEIFPAPAGTEEVYLSDASENGNSFVLEVTSTQFPNQIHHWSPRTAPDTSEMISELPGTLWSLRVNNAGQVCWTTSASSGKITYLDDLVVAERIVIGEDTNRSSYSAEDISEDGTVVGGFYTNTRWGLSSPGMWTFETGWEQIVATEYSNRAFEVNSANQIFGNMDAGFFISSPTDGLFLVDDLVVSGSQPDDLDRWFADGPIWQIGWLGMSDPEETGYGWIAGYLNVGGMGQAFILRPIPATP